MESMEYLSSLRDPSYDREECQDPAADNSDVKYCCVDWSSVPEDLLSIIANKVIHIKDYTVFSAVCTSWQSVYARNKGNLIREPLLLMLPTEDDKDGKTRSLYSLYEKKIYDNLKITLPHNLHCRGSSHGWLTIVHENYEVRLINPFLPSDTEIQLPSLTAFDHDQKRDPIRNLTFLRKVVLSADPTTNPNYIVMAIHGLFGRISFFKPGDKIWTPLSAEVRSTESELALEYLQGICDVIYDQGKFYALHSAGHVLVCDLNGPCANIKPIGREEKILGAEKYLVKSSMGLLQLVRDVEYDSSNSEDEEEELDNIPTNYYTTRFDVFNYDPKMDNWTDVESLNGKVLFVGDNSSMCLSISDMPGCKPNCIYFSDDNHLNYFRYDNFGPRDVGVFNLEDQSAESFYPTESKMFVSAPIFIQPTAKHLSC